MIEIKLTKNLVAQIDECDCDLISKYTWHSATSKRSSPYANTRIFYNDGSSKSYITSMHRLIMGCTFGDGRFVDHIDGNGLNNKRDNLRFVTRSQNAVNRKNKTNKISKYFGVSSVIRGRKTKVKYWTASVRFMGQMVFHGYYKSENDAALAFNEEVVKYYGNFAKLNTIDYNTKEETKILLEKL